MRIILIISCFITVLHLFSCKTSQKIVDLPVVESTILDTLTVTAPKPTIKEIKPLRYNSSAEQKIDLKHMDLEVAFNWEKEQVLGTAILTLSPYFYKTNEIELDAYNMEILDLTLNGTSSLEFKNEDYKLRIKLDRYYSRDEEIKIFIQYIANPSLGKVVEGYNPADLGLYFIDSDQSDPEKPSQIWTQGETEYNSHWFPTVDKPNERYTHDIKITVEDKYVTLSNGYLVSSNKYSKNKRTDHWRMDDEHAPYLTMIAVGEFAVIKDQWEGKPLLYYVEKEYEAYAQNIFNHTPEMLTFFSELTGVKYPWDQYAQIIIRDFVAGAMENTTAVTFGEFIQKTDNELIDNHNDDIVAHEMFHHWFGDYVTCESWANLTLNEGFANYSEYLWTEFQYGQDEADYKRRQELDGYLYQAKNQGAHPLIHYSYEDKEQMFDAHSYNKGGLVLHMLRAEIGDDAFFSGMEKYLKDNAGTSVEVAELRIAYEEITGIDLSTFFNQWYLSSGHPELEINYTINGTQLEIDVKQVQSMETSIPVFNIPLEFDIYDKSGKIVRQSVRMTERNQSFSLSSMGGSIDWVNFDPSHTLLAEFVENKTKEDYLKELQVSKRQYDQNEAMEKLASEDIDSRIYEQVMISDKHYWLKWQAARKVKYSKDKKDLFEKSIVHAKNSFLKGRLISMLREHHNDFEDAFFVKQLNENTSWNVLAPSLGILALKNPTLAQDYIDRWKNENNTRLVFTIGNILAEQKKYDQFDYILSKVSSLSVKALGSYNKLIADMLITSDPDTFSSLLKQINSNVMDNENISTTRKGVVAKGLIELESKLSEDKKILFRAIMEE